MAEETRKRKEEAGEIPEEQGSADGTPQTGEADAPQMSEESSGSSAKEPEEAAAGAEEDPEAAQTDEPDAEDAPREEEGRDAQEPSGADADGDDIVDGAFTQAEEGKKSSFFRKKKDKKDEKIEELTDQVKRQMAEFDNFRKRTDREKSQMFDLGAKSVIEKILPVIDNFERGLAQAGPDSEDPFVQGMEKTYRQMLQELEAIGVTPIEAEGKTFDPNLHNAVMHCEDDSVGENVIVQELQKGYLYHDTVVRHSMVKVAN